MATQPDDANTLKVLCIRDNMSVRAEEAECLHPSSRCDFRPFCDVLKLVRDRKRSAEGDAEH